MMKKIYLIVLILFYTTNLCSCHAKRIDVPEVFVDCTERTDLSDFYMMQYNTTVSEYKEYLEATHSSYPFDKKDLRYYITDDGCAMAGVTLMDVITYANWLSKRNGLKPAYRITNEDIEWDKNANGYRIPTPEEWEYAAKGGNKSKGYKYPGSDILEEVAWFSENSGEMYHHPGELKPNELGLYDMLGNVCEYLWDFYVDFGPRVILSEEYCSPSSEWEEEYQRQRSYQMTHVTTEHFWYMRISDLRALTDDIDEEYVSRYKLIYSSWIDAFTSRERIEKSFYHPTTPLDDEYFGIRLVRNAE